MTLQLIMLYYKNQVWWQTDQQFRRYSKSSNILIINALAVTLTFKTEPTFLQDSPPHENTPYQLWLKIVEWFRRCCLDKIGHTDRMTDGDADRQTKRFQYNPPTPHRGYNKKQTYTHIHRHVRVCTHTQRVQKTVGKITVKKKRMLPIQTWAHSRPNLGLHISQLTFDLYFNSATIHFNILT